jgi:hypothetical protein
MLGPINQLRSQPFSYNLAVPTSDAMHRYVLVYDNTIENLA